MIIPSYAPLLTESVQRLHNCLPVFLPSSSPLPPKHEPKLTSTIDRNRLGIPMKHMEQHQLLLRTMYMDGSTVRFLVAETPVPGP